MARGGEHGTAGDMEAVDPVHAALGVDHAGRGVVGHAGRAARMGDVPERRRVVRPVPHPIVRHQRRQAQPGELVGRQRRHPPHRPGLVGVDAPVDPRQPQAEAVDPVGQGHAAVAVGPLLAHAVERQRVELARHAVALDHVVLQAADEQPRIGGRHQRVAREPPTMRFSAFQGSSGARVSPSQAAQFSRPSASCTSGLKRRPARNTLPRAL